MKAHRFKVKFGFDRSDCVSVDEYEVEKAIFAQIRGTPVQLGACSINGKNIISITPDYHYHTGWNFWYEPESPDDWNQIKRDCPDYGEILGEKKDKVIMLMQTGKNTLIGKAETLEITGHEA